MSKCIVCYIEGGLPEFTRIVNQTGRMISEPRQDFEVVFADMLITQMTVVMDDANHSQHYRLRFS